MITAITAAELFTDRERIASPLLLVEDGLISAIGSQDSLSIPSGAQVRAFPGANLAPGYIDLHIHGSAGYDVMEQQPGGLERMSTFLSRHGVTSYLATTVTAAEDEIYSAVCRIADQIDSWNPSQPMAAPRGIHLEGPCISQIRRGVHPPQYITNPTIELFEKLFTAARGHLRFITIAPELPGALDVIREASRRGVVVSLGHTDGDSEVAELAIAAGASHATHTFNAMRPLNHRDPGVLGKVLTSERLTADIIVDGLHVDPIVVDLFLRSKGPDHAVLITDAISATGMGDGRYKLGKFEVTVKGLRCDYEGHLAGSVLTMDSAVQNVANFASLDLAVAVGLATANPARVLGEDLGSLHVGAPADMVVLSPKGELIETFVAGRSALA